MHVELGRPLPIHQLPNQSSPENMGEGRVQYIVTPHDLEALRWFGAKEKLVRPHWNWESTHGLNKTANQSRRGMTATACEDLSRPGRARLPAVLPPSTHHLAAGPAQPPTPHSSYRHGACL